ncbi:PglD-related sugar-binding protein [Desulfosarcina sp. BuS5]|uniref:PglD-related sugar-binding protein n=1 Tax=Desulfosarcina sp. BuS5 TaxID=933262 RepID=UPI003FCD9E3B
MQNLILIGGGGHCKSCTDVIEQAGVTVLMRRGHFAKVLLYKKLKPKLLVVHALH